ncbi:tryptophan--tRNA ligase [Membranicola marinus]|uniref:Tryptophan--tRNA ligase n=1 Tax=Membranihabitans marinus TaxID=1227546 RepID=A0A953HNC5_9BACT|nr:tryptophan--tRNA ligase [Membranihabitans marinus]MBY5957713.1 tryptophan--tRNA ligase [Membranihabitans marinus]
MSQQSIQQILSLIQPTGEIHLGNYLGAVRNWRNIQDKYSCVFGVADLHAMTMPYNPKKLREATWKMIYQLLAAGIKTENLFVQSLIPEHMELCWILSSVCSYGDLSRMVQFKDKSSYLRDSGGKDELVSSALFFYPVLQAADILIYRADHVPVGKDQEQHLELARGIAQRFNTTYKVDYFKTPQPLYTEVPKVLSLADPNKKMSKSLGDKHVINVFGDPRRIQKQINSAVTDSGEADPDSMSPGVANLFQILRVCGAEATYKRLEEDYRNSRLMYSDLKQSVSDVLLDYLAPMQERYAEITQEKRKYRDQIKASSADIRKKAQDTLREVREITGLQNVKY